jgi:cation transport regulator ChaC
VVEDADGQVPADTEQEDIVWGVAYRIDEAKEEEVREYMGECVERLSSKSVGALWRADTSQRSENRQVPPYSPPAWVTNHKGVR